MTNFSVDEQLRKARLYLKEKQFEDAKNIYDLILKKFPKNIRAQQGINFITESNKNLTTTKLTQENINELLTYYNQGDSISVIQKANNLLKKFPTAYMVWNVLGSVHFSLGELPNAAIAFKKVIDLKPDIPEPYNNYGLVLYNKGDLAQSLYFLKKAIDLNNEYVEAHNNLGNTLKKLNKTNEALKQYYKCLKIRPNYPGAHNNIAIILQEQKHYDKAFSHFKKAIIYKPDYFEAYINLGDLQKEEGKFKDAINSLQKALSINPKSTAANNNLGNVFYELGDFKSAINYFKFALSINPNFVEALNNLGNTFKKQNNIVEAIQCFNNSLSIRPEDENIRMQKIHLQSQICDWKSIEQDKDLIPTLGINDQYISPWSALSIEDNPINHRKRSELYAKSKYSFDKQNILQDQFLNAKHSKIRVGYFSADFHNFPGMYLMIGLLEHHNRENFEIYAFSYGPNSDDPMRKRIIKAVDQFIDIKDMTDLEILSLCKDKEIDIAIHRNGYTKNNRTELFSLRIAPIQINYLGYPGTMGANFIDYIIADQIIIPTEYRDCYSEKIIYMPHSYQPNDNKREISRKKITKSDMGLPEESFVFCSFNNSYKITPEEFHIWMNILNQVEGSVLWLLKSNEWAEENLKKEAEKRGVDINRLVYANKLPHKEHLARLQLADLFIDSFNVNAHTTASDALWAGLPVVTKKGKGFAARVAASLLNAIELPELITDNKNDYQLLILDLAKNPNKLKRIKEKLNKHRLIKPLFNTKQYTENLEDGYKRAYQLYADKKKKETIFI